MSRKTRRVLHTSDLHLGQSGYENFESLHLVGELARKRYADLILIAGDLFDHNRISDDFTRSVATLLQAIGCPVAILAGNHDCLIPGSVLDKAAIWSQYNHIKIFREKHGERLVWSDLGISMWGKSITSEYEDSRPLEGIPEPCPNGCWNIAVAHGFYVDRYPALFPSYHIIHEEINGLTWDYIALGHVPVFRCVSEKPMGYYSGSPSFSKTSALVELSEDRGVVVTCCEF